MAKVSPDPSQLPTPLLPVAGLPSNPPHKVILHFDYDCFYASVFENEQPSLRGLPLGVQQKSILATCNYAARARGVRKLMLVSDAQRQFPDLALVNGEDLTRFRSASKRLWSFLRSHSWNGRVERLGLDEVFLDVSDIVDYNQELLGPSGQTAFFQLSRDNPEKGFAFNATCFSGCVDPPVLGLRDGGEPAWWPLQDPLHQRLLLASHLAGYMRTQLEQRFGFTSSVGISTNKTLAKLAGGIHKPKNQTTLLPVHADTVQEFMDSFKLRQIPGVGSRMSQLIADQLLQVPESDTSPTVRDVRTHLSVSAAALERVLGLGRRGGERGTGARVWALLHGQDSAEVKIRTPHDIPTQISVEDTYMQRPLNSWSEVHQELQSLAFSLIKRMHTDLMSEAIVNNPEADAEGTACLRHDRYWLAHPRTIRLSTRTRPKRASSGVSLGTYSNVPQSESFSRNSRSLPLPSFVTRNSLGDDEPSGPVAAATAERLTDETLVPLFKRLHGNTGVGGAGAGDWNLALINVCVANMIPVGHSGSAGDDGSRTGGLRDIGHMFRTQEHKLREWTVYDDSPLRPPNSSSIGAASSDYERNPQDKRPTWVSNWGPDEEEGMGAISAVKFASEEDDPESAWQEEMDEAEWHDDGSLDGFFGQGPAGGSGSSIEEPQSGASAGHAEQCATCGHAIPTFAVTAHQRFHELGD